MGDSKDYVGTVIDIALQPVEPSGILLHSTLPNLPQRQQVSHKGTYGRTHHRWRSVTGWAWHGRAAIAASAKVETVVQAKSPLLVMVIFIQPLSPLLPQCHDRRFTISLASSSWINAVDVLPMAWVWVGIK